MRIAFFQIGLIFFAMEIVPFAAHATLTPSIQRGEQLIQIHEPGTTTEICVIPKRLNRAMYSDDDLKKEQKLCSLVRGSTAAVCPKLVSTNPGLDFFEVPAGMTSAQVEANSCSQAKMKAKYKYSTSCSYTPSILAYYHFSRILGGAGEVPPSVLRTFDLGEHKQLAELALAETKPDDTIHATWGSYLNFINALPGGKKKDALFTDNLDQSYGALILNPKNEEGYGEFYNGGANQEIRYANLIARNSIFRTLSTNSPLASLIGRNFNASNAQLLEQLVDMSDMIVLDGVLNQEDRLGNVHFRYKYAYLDRIDLNQNGVPRFKLEEASNSTEEAALIAKGAVKIKKIIMKDNDCGVSRVNHTREFKLLEKIRHISPLTYKRLLMLNAQFDQPAVKQLFTIGMMFTPSDYASVRANLAYAAQTLQANCRAGLLKTDLDAEAHFSGQANNSSCEL